MRYLGEQRKERTRKNSFRYRCCILAAILLLFSIVLPFAVAGDMLQVVYDLKSCASVWEKGNDSVEVLSKTSIEESIQQYVVRRNNWQRNAQTLQKRVMFRYRYISQNRLFIWYIIAGFLMFSDLFFICFSDGKRQQKELVPRSLYIVLYRNRADGKKEGIDSSIKQNYFMGGKKDGCYYLDYDGYWWSGRNFFYRLSRIGDADSLDLETIS